MGSYNTCTTILSCSRWNFIWVSKKYYYLLFILLLWLLIWLHYRWNGYTLANVVDGYGGVKLWLPAIFSYLYLAYACHLFYSEYRHFVLKRLEYLIQGDPDTNPQTHYTVMIENVPVGLQSGPALKDFFEKLFPGRIWLLLFFFFL